MKGLLIAALAALGTILAGMVKADLEDEKVCRWLARKLVYRATECLPADERDRWREELIRDLLDLEGRVAPLWWALSVYLHAGRWGRERGVPSRWELLAVRARLAWQRLRDLATQRARARSKQRHPAFQPKADPRVELAGAVAAAASSGGTVVIRSTTRSSGIASLGLRSGMLHLNDRDFIRWLGQQRQAFNDDIDQQVEEWKRRQWRRLGRGG